MSDFFWKYQFPNTKREDIITLLESYNFSERYSDDVNTYYVRGNDKVPVPNEEIIKSLPMYDIINQIGRCEISPKEFCEKLYPKTENVEEIEFGN